MTGRHGGTFADMRMLLVLVPVLVLAAAGCGTAGASDPLTGTSWQLLGIESMAPGEQPPTAIADPTRYTVSFGDDGRAVFTVDCNRGNSTWHAETSGTDSGTLTFGPIALTRMFCPQPSADTEVAAALSQVRGYLISDGKLHLSLAADSGVMHWRPTP